MDNITEGNRIYNKELSKYGNVMDAVQFEKDLAEEKATGYTILGFSTWDGHGYWVKGSKQSSDEIFSTPRLDATDIIWFNK